MNSSLDVYKQRLSELLDALKVNPVLDRRLEKMSEELLSLKDPGLCLWNFSGKNNCSRLPFHSPGDLPDPWIKPRSPALAGKFFITEQKTTILQINK